MTLEKNTFYTEISTFVTAISWLSAKSFCFSTQPFFSGNQL